MAGKTKNGCAAWSLALLLIVVAAVITGYLLIPTTMM
jgi:hypothetical protein